MSSPECEVGGGKAWTLANFEFAELDSACELWWCLCGFIPQRVGSVSGVCEVGTLVVRACCLFLRTTGISRSAHGSAS